MNFASASSMQRISSPTLKSDGSYLKHVPFLLFEVDVDVI